MILILTRKPALAARWIDWVQCCVARTPVSLVPQVEQEVSLDILELIVVQIGPVSWFLATKLEFGN